MRLNIAGTSKVALFVLVLATFVKSYAQSPTDISVVSTDTIHIVRWHDQQGLVGETYNVYVSQSPIVNVGAPDVFRIATDLPENSGTYEYRLYTPGTPGEVAYFYAVTAVTSCEENKNIIPGINATTYPTRGTATWGLAVIFIGDEIFQKPTIDGNTEEYAQLPYVSLDPTTGENYVLGIVNDAADCSGKLWLLMDEENFYFAGRVVDDTLVNVVPRNSGDIWQGDGVGYYFGLYDQRPSQPPHHDYQLGKEPDREVIIAANAGNDIGRVHWYSNGKATPGDGPLSVGEVATKVLADGWAFEARIPFQALVFDASEKVFKPKLGMVLPLNLDINDGDDHLVGGREGQILWNNNPETINSWDRPNSWGKQVIIYDPKQVVTSVGWKH